MKEGDTPRTSIALMHETQAIEEDFINNYRNLPELWDPQHKHYTNKHRRNAAHDILVSVMKRWDPSANRYSVRKKINVLRSCYRKDLKKYNASKYIGPDGEESYEYNPKSWKFYALRFLEKDNEKDGIVEVNIEDKSFQDERSDETSENDEPSDVLASISENESLRQKFATKLSNKRLKVELEDEEAYYTENDDLLDRELQAIGANVTCKLKRMNSDQRYHAELLINKVLITGLKNNLTDDTDLTEVYKT